MKLFVRTDIEGDQAYIGFDNAHEQKRGVVKKTVRVTEEIALDFDSNSHLVGIDIANASRVLGRRVFTETLASDELVGVAEAAKLCGVRKPNFIRDFAGRPDFPEPIAELASGRFWLRSEIESHLQSDGRSGTRLRHIT